MTAEVVESARQPEGPGSGAGGVWVDPARVEVQSESIGGLPVVNAVLERLGLVDLVASYLDPPDVRRVLPTDAVIAVVVRNLTLGRQPLYGLSAWAAGYDPALLGIGAGKVGALNDDRVGRALDELFLADRASLVTALGLAAVRGYDIDCDELHNDSTSLTLYGAYRTANGVPRGADARPSRPGPFERSQARPEAAGVDPDHDRRRRGADHPPARGWQHRGLHHPHRHLGRARGDARPCRLPLHR